MKKYFGKMSTNHELQDLTIANAGGVRVTCIRLGATIASLLLPNGTDIVLGYKDSKNYCTNAPYIGCMVGRVANRIKDSVFSLDGKDHHVSSNDPPNHLHGGFVGFNKVVWELKYQEQNELMFEHISAAKTEGYPGMLTATVRYTLTDNNELYLTYTATTDAPTIVSLTNHTYFNLAGKGTIHDHILCIPADQTTDLSGNVISVAGKETDFRSPTPIKDKMTGDASNGFDLNYSLLGVVEAHDGHREMRLCASLQEPLSGNQIRVFSDRPGMQLYTGNFLDGSYTGKDGNPLDKHCGVCLETQAWPNAINIAAAAEQVVLPPGQVSRTTTVWCLAWNNSPTA